MAEKFICYLSVIIIMEEKNDVQIMINQDKNRRVQKATLETLSGFMIGVGGGSLLSVADAVEPGASQYVGMAQQVFSSGVLVAGVGLTIKGIYDYCALVKDCYK